MSTAHLHLFTRAPSELLEAVGSVVRGSARAAGETEVAAGVPDSRAVVIVEGPGPWIGVYDTAIEQILDVDPLARRLSSLGPVVAIQFLDEPRFVLYAGGDIVDSAGAEEAGDAELWSTTIEVRAPALASAWRGAADGDVKLERFAAALGWSEDDALARAADIADGARRIIRLAFRGAATLDAQLMRFIQRSGGISALEHVWSPAQPVVGAAILLEADRARAGQAARRALLRWNQIIAPTGSAYKIVVGTKRQCVTPIELTTILRRRRDLGSSSLSAVLRSGHGFELDSTKIAPGLSDPSVPLLSLMLGSEEPVLVDALRELVDELMATSGASQASLVRNEPQRGMWSDLNTRVESNAERQVMRVPDDTLWLGEPLRSRLPPIEAAADLVDVSVGSQVTRLRPRGADGQAALAKLVAR